MLELYYASGACSFIPHVTLEIIKTATGTEYTPKPVKLHRGEHKTPEFLAINPNGQVPVLVVDGQPLSQIVAICDYLDRRFPQVGLLPTEPWARAKVMSQFAWMNNTVHPTFTHVFMPQKFADGEAAQAELRRFNSLQYRACLERIQEWIGEAKPFWLGERVGILDAYALTLLRWGGFAGIDPDSLPAYKAFVARVAATEPVATIIARERIDLNTFKKA
ncbi:MAG: glutathione S-transferase family protein [Burkholderiales bacterium]|nr:glutathione S-transferase family protein [Burkholderiales bacterium]